MALLSVTWQLKAAKLEQMEWGLPIGNAHGINTGDELRLGSAGNDARGVPCSIQMPFFLYIPQSHFGWSVQNW